MPETQRYSSYEALMFGADVDGDTYVELVTNGDVMVPFAWSQEATSQSGSPAKLVLPGELEVGIEFQMNADTANPHFAALRTACENRTPVRMWALSGASDAVGSRGPQMIGTIVEAPEEKAANKAVVVKFKFFPRPWPTGVPYAIAAVD